MPGTGGVGIPQTRASSAGLNTRGRRRSGLRTCQLGPGAPGALRKGETTPKDGLWKLLSPAAGCYIKAHKILLLARGVPVKFLPLELSPAAVPIFLPVDHADKIGLERHNRMFIISVIVNARLEEYRPQMPCPAVCDTLLVIWRLWISDLTA